MAKGWERVDHRPAYTSHGVKVIHMVTSGGYVMVKEARQRPFVLTLKEWANLTKEPPKGGGQ